ncbi:MAG: CARDB domain-containing protein [Candidatus Saliniplasma sp.]
MKSKIISLTIILMLSVISLSVVFSGYSRAEEFSSRGVSLFIDGDEEVFVNETNIYEVTIDGVFGRNAENWTLNSSVTEGTATILPESDESNSSNVFEVEMNAVESGTIVMEFEAFCSDGDEIRRKVETFEVNVIKPSTISVVVRNPTNTTIEDIEVGLFINSELRRVKHIDSLEAEDQERIEFNWSDEGLESGEHQIEIWVDYGFEETEEFHKDSLILEKSFYIPDEGTQTLYNALIILLILGVIGAFFFYQHKKKKRRRPW